MAFMTIERESVVILIVDDDDLVLKTLNVLVASLGYKCLLASDGVEAVEILSNTPCDLVLSDVLMPNMDGLELLSYVREKHPEIDVIIATGFSERASYADVIRLGAIDTSERTRSHGVLLNISTASTPSLARRHL